MFKTFAQCMQTHVQSFTWTLSACSMTNMMCDSNGIFSCGKDSPKNWLNLVVHWRGREEKGNIGVNLPLPLLSMAARGEVLILADTETALGMDTGHRSATVMLTFRTWYWHLCIVLLVFVWHKHVVGIAIMGEGRCKEYWGINQAPRTRPTHPSLTTAVLKLTLVTL